MGTHNDAERPAATGYGTVPDPIDSEAWVNAGVAEDIKDALAAVVLAGFRGVPPNETYRMTGATLTDVCGRVLTHLTAHPTSTPANHQRVTCRHSHPEPRQGVIAMRIRLTGTAGETERAAAALSGVLRVREVSPFYPNWPPSLLGRVYLDAEPPTTNTTDTDKDIDWKDSDGWSA